jgi:hypothetical protein
MDSFASRAAKFDHATLRLLVFLSKSLQKGTSDRPNFVNIVDDYEISEKRQCTASYP